MFIVTRRRRTDLRQEVHVTDHKIDIIEYTKRPLSMRQRMSE